MIMSSPMTLGTSSTREDSPEISWENGNKDGASDGQVEGSALGDTDGTLLGVSDGSELG